MKAVDAHRDKTVLITGCSSGIGLCAARGLRQRGYRVFATARKPEDVRRLLDEGFESLSLDLADSASIQQAIDKLLRLTEGRLYALFNNGAYGQMGAVEDLTREALRAQFETNVFGTHELTTQVLKAMRRQGCGRIIQNSSLLGFVALKYRGAYTASKFALEALTDTLRLELAGTGIHVSIIEPGPILSRFRENAMHMYRAYIDAEHSAHHAKYMAMEARLEKMGPAVPFTLGPEAVLQRVIHALESPQPKIRYCVTVPAYVFAGLRRILPWSLLDSVLRRVG
jgi:NAD(P)-dependent dehydrogenase (short-subunit alcohol dehydrogenase family)